MTEALKRAWIVGLIGVAAAVAGCTSSSADNWAQTSPVIKAEPQPATAGAKPSVNARASAPETSRQSVQN
jgi:hypothetical protein